MLMEYEYRRRMTLLTNDTTTAELATDRTRRLTAAGEAWNARIAAKGLIPPTSPIGSQGRGKVLLAQF
ncbi:hypothetical protein ADILRU_0705 [Leifsonia rubra CMS 76R]|nr:hypothetical protein ADILRU_0705 [Leifsonia rubra CMS 76R]